MWWRPVCDEGENWSAKAPNPKPIGKTVSWLLQRLWWGEPGRAADGACPETAAECDPGSNRGCATDDANTSRWQSEALLGCVATRSEMDCNLAYRRYRGGKGKAELGANRFLRMQQDSRTSSWRLLRRAGQQKLPARPGPRRPPYPAVQPPSTSSDDPVTSPAASEHRNRIAPIRTYTCSSRPWQGGAQVMMRGTPASFAVTTEICAEASSGYLPHGT